MGVDEGGLQVIDIQVMYHSTSTCSPVTVALSSMVFVIHTIYLTFMTA